MRKILLLLIIQFPLLALADSAADYLNTDDNKYCANISAFSFQKECDKICQNYSDSQKCNKTCMDIIKNKTADEVTACEALPKYAENGIDGAKKTFIDNYTISKSVDPKSSSSPLKISDATTQEPTTGYGPPDYSSGWKYPSGSASTSTHISY